MANRTTDKYEKVGKESQPAPENEIRIRAGAPVGRYISYAATLLHEQKHDVVVFKASGVAVSSACQVAEILRHKIKGLHQLNKIESIPVVDEYKPKEKGLDNVKVTRNLVVLEISISLKSVLDTKAAGYQAPLPDSEVQAEDLEKIIAGRREVGEGQEGGRPRGRGRGGRGGRGRGRGGRGGDFGGRGRGRGGYGGGRGGRRDDYEDRERGYGGDRERNYGGDRERGYGGRGGRREDYEDRPYRGGSRGGDRGDRPRGSRGGDRGDRGDRPRGSRGGDRERRD